MTTATVSQDFEKLLDEIVSKFLGHAPIRPGVRKARPRSRSPLSKRSHFPTFNGESTPVLRRR